MTTSRMTRALVAAAAAVSTVLAVTSCSATGAAVVVTKTVTSNPYAAPTTSSQDPAPSSSVAVTSTPASTSAASTHPTTTVAPPTSTKPTPKPKPVHVSTFEGDGSTYGIGMAVMVLFSKAPTDSGAFTKAAIVTVNGKKADGAWFWQAPTVPGYAMEALYREKGYWPAHSSIEVDLPVNGLSAGPGLAYDDSLTVTFKIGAAHVSQVDNAQHRMVVTSDGTVVKNMPVSLGYANTPTYNGTKVIMAKGSVAPGTHTPLPQGQVRMVSAPGEPYYNLMVPWSVRITNSGEFIHAASWNTGNIGSRNTSHGCTNLDPKDAEWFYNFSLIGDVVQYPDANAKGTVQPSWDGWGWWNVPWSEWSRGGELINH